MELKQFVVLLLRWFWLLLLGLCLGAVIGILIGRAQEPGYQAEAKVLVMRVPDQVSMGFAYLGDQQLSQTFSELIKTQPVLDTVSKLLEFNVDPTKVQIQKNPNSQIINVIVEDIDPQLSVRIANTLVLVAINRYVSLQVGQYTSIEKDIRNQLNMIQNEMTSTQSQIKEISESILKSQKQQILSQMTPLQDEVSQLLQDIAKLTPAITSEKLALIAEKQARLDQISPLLIAYQNAYSNLVVLNLPVEKGSVDETNLILLKKTLDDYQQNYVSLTSKLDLLLQSHSQGISNVTIIQDASNPSAPVRPRKIIYTLLSSAIGLILAVVAIFILDNFGISFKIPASNISNSKVEEKLDKPAKKKNKSSNNTLKTKVDEIWTNLQRKKINPPTKL